MHLQIYREVTGNCLLTYSKIKFKTSNSHYSLLKYVFGVLITGMLNYYIVRLLVLYISKSCGTCLGSLNSLLDM